MPEDFSSWESAGVVLGIRRGITGLILSQGCRLLPLKFPPPQMKVAVEVEDGDASLPAVKFLQAF